MPRKNRKQDRPHPVERFPVGDNFAEIVPGQGDPPRYRWFLADREGNVLGTCPVRGYETQAIASEKFHEVRRCLQIPLEQKFQRQAERQDEAVKELRSKVEVFRTVTQSAEAAARRWRKTAFWMISLAIIAAAHFILTITGATL